MTCTICNRKDCHEVTINGTIFYLCYQHDIKEVHEHIKITRRNNPLLLTVKSHK